MILTTWFTSLGKTKNQKKSNCPYKLEPSCGVLLEKHLDLSEKPLREGLKPVKNVFGRTTRRILRKPWLTVMLVVFLVSLNACGGKVILLKDGEMRLLDDGSYAVSEAWMEERLQFENDMVKRLSECNAND